MFGLPPPSFEALITVFRNSGALRKSPHSNKLPLFATTLERMWRLPDAHTNPFNLRNIALCVTTYFFMLRGCESRQLKRNQLQLLKKEGGEEVWKVTLEYSKSDPLILGSPPPGGSWEGFTSNTFFSKVMSVYLFTFLGLEYPVELPLFPQFDVIHSPKDPQNPFSRRAPGKSGESWLLHPLETRSGGKVRAGYLTTSDTVNKWLKITLRAVGVESHHTMHSLRVGAATEALSLGAPLSQIKIMGHWKSLAVLTYAAESLSSITATTKLFGSKELRSLGPVVDAKEKPPEMVSDEDGDVDADGGPAQSLLSLSPPAQ